MRRTVRDVLATALAVAILLAGIGQAGAQASPEAALEANKAPVRRYFEIAGQGDLATLTEVVSPELVIRTAPPGEGNTLQSLTATLAAARAGLPDFAFRVDDLIAEGDVVVVRTTISGTHLGDFFGAPPTGKRIETTAIDVWRIADGKLAENWHFEDILSVMRQLGAIPGEADANSSPKVSLTPGFTPPSPPPLEGGVSPSALGEGSAGVAEVDLAANEALARRFHDEIFAQGNLDVADEILAPDFVWHRDVAPGVEGVKAFAAEMQAGLPDLALTADLVIAEGDRVAIVWTLTGTHEGLLVGAQASGNRVMTSGADIYRIADGKIAEVWTVGDDLGFLMQLGAIPAFGEAMATP